MTLLMVSHDQHFLNAVCTDIVLIEAAKLHYFPGDYDDFKQRTLSARSRRSFNTSAADGDARFNSSSLRRTTSESKPWASRPAWSRSHFRWDKAVTAAWTAPTEAPRRHPKARRTQHN